MGFFRMEFIVVFGVMFRGTVFRNGLGENNRFKVLVSFGFVRVIGFVLFVKWENFF